MLGLQEVKMSTSIKTYDPFNRSTPMESDRIAEFLHTHLEQYGDSISAIKKCIAYALKERAGLGGKIFVAHEDDVIQGVVVVNRTGMEEYIPENILVYIATHHDHRGKGVGKKLMQAVLDQCSGDIALHVEKDNPAKHLYTKMGFTNPYLEMRLKR
jgi:GNAT superfamily N-acetyltransferase